MNIRPRGPLAARQLPLNDIGKKEDIQTILNYLKVPFYGDPLTKIAVTTNQADSLMLERRSLPNESLVPNVVGMGLRDALFILENRNLKVEVNGFGKVIQQSIIPMTKAQGQTIRLTLG